MTKEEEAIKILSDSKILMNIQRDTALSIRVAIETVLNMLKEKDKEIEKKDNAVRKIIKRLDNDIERIAKSKAENNWDDYRRCRLKAYKTKTREIKEYIEEQYFERKSKGVNICI